MGLGPPILLEGAYICVVCLVDEYPKEHCLQVVAESRIVHLIKREMCSQCPDLGLPFLERWAEANGNRNLSVERLPHFRSKRLGLPNIEHTAP